MKWNERDPIAEREILAGNIPPLLKKLVRIKTSILDSSSGKTITADYWVSPIIFQLVIRMIGQEFHSHQ